jgi:hypothetical protein
MRIDSHGLAGATPRDGTGSGPKAGALRVGPSPGRVCRDYACSETRPAAKPVRQVTRPLRGHSLATGGATGGCAP